MFNDLLTYCSSVHIVHGRCISHLSFYCILQLFAAYASAPGLQDTLNVCLAVRSEYIVFSLFVFFG